MNRTNTLTGFYGGSHTPCNVFTCCIGGVTWYAVEGSQNVNAVEQWLADGVDVEELNDVDMFTWPDGIDSEETLLIACEA